MPVANKTLTVGELMAALSRVPSYTPVRCHVVVVDANHYAYDTGDTGTDGACYEGTTQVVAARQALNEVVLEVEE